MLYSKLSLNLTKFPSLETKMYSMKKLFTIVFALVLFSAPFAESKAQKVTDYETAVGLRLAWGISATGKHFINDAHAIEGILNYRSFGFGSFNYGWMRITGLYLVHNDLSEVMDNLSWYWGGGAYVGFYTGDFDYSGSRFKSTFIGISGAIGLDYSLPNTPVNVSLDWIPSFRVTGGGNGFSGESGGIAVRYILQ